MKVDAHVDYPALRDVPDLARAAEALRCSERDVERFIGELKATLRAPWAAEHRDAFAAAMAELSERTKLRLPLAAR